MGRRLRPGTLEAITLELGTAPLGVWHGDDDQLCQPPFPDDGPPCHHVHDTKASNVRTRVAIALRLL